MKETEAIIERIRRINSEYQHLELAVDSSLARVKPGQSILARLTASYDPYLREQWWPVGVASGKMIVERPGSERYEPGQIINVIGLVGQPFLFRRTLRNVLLVAYNSMPIPLLLTIPWLLGNNISVTLVLIGEATKYNTQHLPPEVEIVHGDEEINWPNQVMTVGWADQVFAVVARDDEGVRFAKLLERFKERRADVPSNYLFGVFQPTMTCAAGACHACMLQVREGLNLICTDGPAFDLTQVILK
ncbi:MAG: hypothetical protein H7Y09_07900 [Chitinophagaceae bacterium]|nr:hypothetical protein [Anaerolineae bacterium]